MSNFETVSNKIGFRLTFVLMASLYIIWNVRCNLFVILMCLLIVLNVFLILSIKQSKYLVRLNSFNLFKKNYVTTDSFFFQLLYARYNSLRYTVSMYFIELFKTTKSNFILMMIFSMSQTSKKKSRLQKI